MLAGFAAARMTYGDDVPPPEIRDPIVQDALALHALLPERQKKEITMIRPTRDAVTTDGPAPETRDAGLDAAMHEVRDRRRAEDAALIRAQQERAKPACDRARAAIAKLDAFAQTFGPQLRAYRDQLEDPDLDAWFARGPAPLLRQTRAQVEDLLSGIAQIPALQRTVAELDHLELKDVTPWCIVGNRMERLNGMANHADVLPADLTALAASMAEIGRTLARLIAEAAGSPVLDPAPPPARVDGEAPRSASARAKGAVTHGEDS
jgi:hypothetical protein